MRVDVGVDFQNEPKFPTDGSAAPSAAVKKRTITLFFLTHAGWHQPRFKLLRFAGTRLACIAGVQLLRTSA